MIELAFCDGLYSRWFGEADGLEVEGVEGRAAGACTRGAEIRAPPRAAIATEGTAATAVSANRPAQSETAIFFQFMIHSSCLFLMTLDILRESVDLAERIQLT